MIVKRHLVIPADHAVGTQIQPVTLFDRNTAKNHFILVASNHIAQANMSIYFILGHHASTTQVRDRKDQLVETRHEYQSLSGLPEEDREKIVNVVKTALAPKEGRKTRVIVQTEEYFLNALKNPNNPLECVRVEEME